MTLSTFITQNLKTFVHTFVLFHAGKSVLFMSPNGFKNRAKKYLILGLWGIGGTIASIGWYHRLQISKIE